MNDSQALAAFGRYLYQLARTTKSVERLKAIRGVAFRVSALLEIEAVSLQHDLFTEIMLFVDHRLWRSTGRNDIAVIQQRVEEILDRIVLD